MQTKHLFTVLSVTFALVLMPCVGFAEVITWNGDGDGINWNQDSNWDLDRKPAAGDDVVIEGDCKAIPPLVVTLQSHSGSTDGVCETLDIGCATLLIKGVKLTLGSATEDTTSFIWHVGIQFRWDGDNPAELSIHKWVTFVGKGALFAHQETPGGPDKGQITRAGEDGIGIKLDDNRLRMTGSLDVLCSFHHEGFEVGVFDEKDIMRFGEAYVDPYDPELVISGTGLNDETITASRGKVEFHQIQFASTAPKWLIKGDSESNTGTMLLTDQRNDAPNDITLEDWALLNMREDFDCTGTLTFEKDCTVRVAAGKIATFD